MDEYNDVEFAEETEAGTRKGVLVGAGLVGLGAGIGLGGRWLFLKIKERRADRKEHKKYRAEAAEKADEIG